VPLSPIAQRYEQFILDLDGCVWIGDEPTPRAVEALDALRDSGRDVVYATNDPRSATEDYVARLWKIGIRASVRDVVTVGGATQHLLAETRSGRTAFVVGTEALRRHVTDAGLRVLNGTDLASRAEVVVVGGPQEHV
jgi:ribonucleotide monophosphatase NagD (HAD superfamily)